MYVIQNKIVCYVNLQHLDTNLSFGVNEKASIMMFTCALDGSVDR